MKYYNHVFSFLFPVTRDPRQQLGAPLVIFMLGRGGGGGGGGGLVHSQLGKNLPNPSIGRSLH